MQMFDNIQIYRGILANSKLLSLIYQRRKSGTVPEKDIK